VNSPTTTQKRTSNARPNSLAKNAARRVLDELNIRKPSEINVELICAHYGAFVLFKPLSNEEGHLLRRGQNAIVVVNDAHAGTSKERFIEAHELGHFLRHDGVDQFELCTNADLNNWYSSAGYEQEANVFAAELLMPEFLFARRCDRNKPSLSDVRELATEFRTSLTATGIRFVECCPEPVALVHSTGGKIDWSIRTPDFCFSPTRGARLPNTTYAGDIFAGKRVDDRPQLIDGAGWPGGREIDIQEHSIRLGARDSVLTLLWHKYS